MGNKRIENDIVRIDEAILGDKHYDIVALYNELSQIYMTIIPDLEKSLLPVSITKRIPYNPKTKAPPRSETKDFSERYKENLIIIKGKLELQINEQSYPSGDMLHIHIDNRSSSFSTSEAFVKINVSFDDVRNQIKKMSNLSPIDNEEIVNKINELESIVMSNNSQGDKWKKAKNIGKWIFEKSVDVGIALLPLFFNIHP